MFLLVEPRFRLWFHLKLRAPPTSRPLNGGRTLWQISPLSLRPSLNIHYYFLPSTTIRYYPLISTSIHKYQLKSKYINNYYPLLRHGTSMLNRWELGSVPARLISTLQNGVERVSGLLLINSEWFDWFFVKKTIFYASLLLILTDWLGPDLW